MRAAHVVVCVSLAHASRYAPGGTHAHDVREIERIELRPQHVALEFDRGDASFLHLARAGVRLHELEREGRVARASLSRRLK